MSVSVGIGDDWRSDKVPALRVAWEDGERVLFDGTTLADHPLVVIQARRRHAIAAAMPSGSFADLIGRRICVALVPKTDKFGTPME